MSSEKIWLKCTMFVNSYIKLVCEVFEFAVIGHELVSGVFSKLNNISMLALE